MFAGGQGAERVPCPAATEAPASLDGQRGPRDRTAGGGAEGAGQEEGLHLGLGCSDA